MCPHGAAKSVLAAAYFEKKARSGGSTSRCGPSARSRIPRSRPPWSAAALDGHRPSRREAAARVPRRPGVCQLVVSMGCDLTGRPVRGEVRRWDRPEPIRRFRGDGCRDQAARNALVEESRGRYGTTVAFCDSVVILCVHARGAAALAAPHPPDPAAPAYLRVKIGRRLAGPGRGGHQELRVRVAARRAGPWRTSSGCGGRSWPAAVRPPCARPASWRACPTPTRGPLQGGARRGLRGAGRGGRACARGPRRAVGRAADRGHGAVAAPPAQAAGRGRWPSTSSAPAGARPWNGCWPGSRRACGRAAPARRAGGRSAADFRGRMWVTRRGIQVDRMASAWLIRRFIDPKARFKFVAWPGVRAAAGRGALRHVRGGVHARGRPLHVRGAAPPLRLSRTPRSRALGEIVHDIDLKDGRFGRPEAVGVDRLIAGIALRHARDEARLARGGRRLRIALRVLQEEA